MDEIVNVKTLFVNPENQKFAKDVISWNQVKDKSEKEAEGKILGEANLEMLNVLARLEDNGLIINDLRKKMNGLNLFMYTIILVFFYKQRYLAMVPKHNFFIFTSKSGSLARFVCICFHLRSLLYSEL